MKIIKKLLVMCAALLIFAGIVQTEVKAESYTFDKTPIITDKIPDHGYRCVLINGEAEIVKITQGKRLAKIEIDEVYPKAVMIYPKKIGATVLSVTVKSGDKTKVHKVKLRVLKYKNPAKTFKIGNEEYKNKFKKVNTCYFSAPKKNQNVKIFVKPSSGYKIVSMRYRYNKENGMNGEVNLKNGQRFKLRALVSGTIQVTFQKKSTGHTINLAIFYRR